MLVGAMQASPCVARPPTVIPVSPGTLSDHTNLIRDAIAQAMEAPGPGPHTVLFEPGVYYVSGVDPSHQDLGFTFPMLGDPSQPSNQKAVILDGVPLNGAYPEIIHTTRGVGMFLFYKLGPGCQVKNLVLDVAQSAVPFTQGTVVDVDEAEKRFTVSLDAGYPTPAELQGAYSSPGGGVSNVWTADGKKIKLGTHHMVLGPGTWSQVGGNWVFNVAAYGGPTNIATYDKFTLGWFNHGAVIVNHVASFLADNVTIYGSSGMGITNQSTDDPVVTGCKILRRPGSGRILTGWDGYHFQGTRGGKLTNCVAEGLQDDCNHVYGQYNEISAVTQSGNLYTGCAIATTTNPLMRIAENDVLEIVNPEDGYAMHYVQVATVSTVNPGVIDVTFTTAVPSQPAWKPINTGAQHPTRVWNQDRSGKGFESSYNTFRNCAARGIIMRAHNALVIGNHMQSLGWGGLQVCNGGAGSDSLTGPYPRAGRFQDNTFTDCRRIANVSDLGTILVASWKGVGNWQPTAAVNSIYATKGHTFANNVIEGGYPNHALLISGADSITVEALTCINNDPMRPRWPHPPSSNDSRGITVRHTSGANHTFVGITVTDTRAASYGVRIEQSVGPGTVIDPGELTANVGQAIQDDRGS